MISINGRNIGEAHPPYIIAELSANHNGSLQRAVDSISAAKNAGSDAVKIQTYTADTMTIKSDRKDFVIQGGLWDGYTLYDLYEEAHTPFEWHKPLFDHARKIGITIFSTPFDETAVDLLEDLNTPAYKIASFEAIDLPLIRYVAQTKKPMIISTGMADFDEISEAVQTAKDAGCKEIILLHCISAYPAPIEQSNLRTIGDLKAKFDVISGLSDHSMGNIVPITAVAQGACLIEKHFTLSRKEEGPDSSFSLEPDELESLCNETKRAWEALGSVNYHRKEAEKSSMVFRRSIYVTKAIKKGEEFSENNIRRIRPGYGLPPKYFDSIIGKKAAKDIAEGVPLSMDLVL
jgi:pseudaminic acid synthase